MSTADPLPDTIHVVDSSSGLNVRLPYRTTQPLLAQAGKPLLAGVAAIAVGVGLMTVHFSLGIGPVFIGILLMAASGFYRCTWSQAELKNDQLQLTEWFGPFPNRRTRPLGYLRQMVVHRLREGDNAEPPPNGVIEVVCEGAQTLWFAPGYPYEWLVPLAEQLAGRCQIPHSESPNDGSPTVKIPPLFMEPLRDSDTFDRDEQPEKSRIAVERTPDGATVIDVPPGNLFGGVFGTALILVPFLAITLSGVFQALPVPWNVITLPILTVPGLVLLAWHRSWRRTVLVLRPDDLAVLWTGGLLKDTVRHWPRTLVKAIRTGPGHITKHGEDVQELHIYFHTGEPLGLFCNRDNDELAWLATVLRRELNVPAVVRETVEHF